MSCCLNANRIPHWSSFSQERGKHSNERERRAAGDRAGPGRRLDARATPPHRRRMGGGFRAHHVHWDTRGHHVCVSPACASGDPSSLLVSPTMNQSFIRSRIRFLNHFQPNRTNNISLRPISITDPEFAQWRLQADHRRKADISKRWTHPNTYTQSTDHRSADLVLQ